MLTVVVGVILTALLGGLLVPIVKDGRDRRSERFRSSLAPVDALAADLWTYWTAAVRVAYYGKQGPNGARDLETSLQRWDNDASWTNGHDIRIQVSRSKRLLPPGAHERLDRAQQEVVGLLAREIDRLRHNATADEWERLYRSLMRERRTAIDRVLGDVMSELDLT